MLTDDSALRRIRELEATVRVLEDQNVQLKIAARDFGALGYTRLMVRSGESWRVRVQQAVGRLVSQFGVARLRT